jgi:multidrug resistance efflux pump
MPSLKVLLPILFVVFGGIAFYFYSQKTEAPQEENISAFVKKGEFVVKVTATGELKAKRSEKIRGPQGMRTAQIHQTNITDMIAEGTLVKAGDYVATLDKTELDNKMKDAMTEIEKIETQLEQAKIDTTIELRGIRDELINLKFAKQEKLLYVEQSKFEAKSVIQQAEIDLQRTERDYSQLEAKFRLSQTKAEAKISEINASLKQQNLKLKILTDLAREFIIKAPKDGMLIYARSWDGKVGPGSRISSWNPTVAELPDLSDMVSKTFVNEVDISRVQKGQDVKISVDAFPDKEYTGQVIKVANIGEQLRNYDSKVFEVTVQVNEVDSILRPAMTTGNEIVTNIYTDVLFIPIEALYNDSLSFVYKKENGKIVKQEVITGTSNEDEILVEHGLAEGDEILLAEPTNATNLTFVPLDQKIKDEILKKQEEDRKARQALMEEKKKKVKDEEISNDNTSGGGFIIFN